MLGSSSPTDNGDKGLKRKLVSSYNADGHASGAAGRVVGRLRRAPPRGLQTSGVLNHLVLKRVLENILFRELD